jgi:hypothetical protein
VVYDSSIDNEPNAPDGGGINPEKLPLNPAKSCTPVYPHDYVRVNNIFEVIKQAGGRTAWADKHPAYEFLNGRYGKGVDDPMLCLKDHKRTADVVQAIRKQQTEAGIQQIFSGESLKLMFAASAKSFHPAACHPDRPIYGSGPLCRKCSDLVRWQGERGKSKVRAYVADNPSLNAAMRADVEDKIGKLKAYERKLEKERNYVDTRKPSVAKHAATTVIVNALDYDKAAVELKPDMTPYEQHKLAH